MPIVRKIIFIFTAPKRRLTPSAQLPAQPEPHMLFALASAGSLFTHPGTRARGVQKGPRQARGWGAKWQQDLVSHSSLFSLPLCPYLTTCQKLFKHWETPSHMDHFYSLESKEYLRWFPESQTQIPFLPLGSLFRVKASFHPPGGTHSP